DVEELAVVERSLARHRLEQRLVEPGQVDAPDGVERELDVVRLSRGEDRAPAAEPIDALSRRVPDGHVLRLAAEPPGAPDVQDQPVVAVLRRPLGLAGPGDRLKALKRHAWAAADVLDVDGHRVSTSLFVCRYDG